jgi:hypothetical protein
MHEASNFSLLGGGRKWRDFEKTFLGPMGLPSNSQTIPQDIPNNISNLSHMFCPKFNSHVYKLKMWAIGEHMGEKTCFNWGMPNVLKTLMMGHSIWFLQKEKL